VQDLILWIHALAALLFAVLATAQARTGASALPAGRLAVALTLTALWSLAVAGIGFGDVVTRLTETLRQLGWLGLMIALAWTGGTRPDRPIVALYVVVSAVLVLTLSLTAAAATWEQVSVEAKAAIDSARLVLRIIAAMGALILLRDLFQGPALRGRTAARLAALAAASLWLTDLSVYAGAWIAGTWPPAVIAARGVALLALAPMLALASQRRAMQLQLSRTVALQSLSVVGLGLYAALTGIAMGVIGDFGGANARMVQTALVFGSAAALLTVVSTPWLRAWAKVLVAKHLFSHRYDYRAEWLRFTETLGAPGGEEQLDQRVVKAVADITDSTAGLLLVPDGEDLLLAARWNWPGAEEVAGAPLVRHLAATHRIVELDAVREGRDPADAGHVPGWILDHADAWAIVPLVHDARLTGAIVLARPAVDRGLDWEDFDLLGVAGRQAASYLAEDRARSALAEAARFDEFNRRFAFILHDIKNLVSQVTLVARNAERHADNPDFRADMVATLRETSDRMTMLLSRLGQRGPRPLEPSQAVPVAPLLTRIADRRRSQHPVHVEAEAVTVRAAPGALETLVDHLVQNAIEASGPDAPVVLSAHREGARVAVEVRDRGSGMSAAFVRDRLFKPFDSMKPGGFGIGAFEARQLAEAMGGEVAVVSREGQGTCFTVLLPIAAGEGLDMSELSIGRAA
jgi:putative PEP-CTERM system histidine kinase